MKKKIWCPICGGGGELDAPSLKQKKINQKKAIAKKLYKKGYSMRKIMQLMDYKSPRSVHKLIRGV